MQITEFNDAIIDFPGAQGRALASFAGGVFSIKGIGPLEALMLVKMIESQARAQGKPRPSVAPVIEPEPALVAEPQALTPREQQLRADRVVVKVDGEKIAAAIDPETKPVKLVEPAAKVEPPAPYDDGSGEPEPEDANYEQEERAAIQEQEAAAERAAAERAAADAEDEFKPATKPPAKPKPTGIPVPPAPAAEAPKRRGRPPGSPNKPKPEVEAEVETETEKPATKPQGLDPRQVDWTTPTLPREPPPAALACSISLTKPPEAQMDPGRRSLRDLYKSLEALDVEALIELPPHVLDEIDEVSARVAPTIENMADRAKRDNRARWIIAHKLTAKDPHVIDCCKRAPLTKVIERVVAVIGFNS